MTAADADRTPAAVPPPGGPGDAGADDSAPSRPHHGVLAQILGRDDDDDRPLPEFPPLPADPRWRVGHLGLVTAVGLALALVAGPVVLLFAGPTAGLGVAAGMVVVTVGVTVSTLAIAAADTIRPALVLPVGVTVYVVKYLTIALLLVAAGASGWSGAVPMAFGLAVGAVATTLVQVWWITRLARRRLPTTS